MAKDGGRDRRVCPVNLNFDTSHGRLASGLLAIAAATGNNTAIIATTVTSTDTDTDFAMIAIIFAIAHASKKR